jgi:hypothetical protein
MRTLCLFDDVFGILVAVSVVKMIRDGFIANGFYACHGAIEGANFESLFSLSLIWDGDNSPSGLLPNVRGAQHQTEMTGRFQPR